MKKTKKVRKVKLPKVFSNRDAIHYIIYKQLDIIGVSEPYLKADIIVEELIERDLIKFTRSYNR